ncbi:MAG: fumarylacetoacetase, partial [Actinomycetota bacterium]|nr:fumarylacetoacetase [Actinomycetota bacterium]
MSWIDVPNGSPFPVQNLPYGVFRYADEPARVGVALGDQVLDLAPLSAAEGLDGGHVFEEPSLNPFMALGRPAWTAVRAWLTELLTHDTYRDLVESHLLPAADVEMLLPFEVADYVDFYSSQHHAENVGRIFRPDAEPLTPNWKHLPVGYHGRSGTVVVSGTDVVRPSGQRKSPTDQAPSFGPSTRLDIEAEVGFV